jgi:subtilisin family serine protease
MSKRIRVLGCFILLIIVVIGSAALPARIKGAGTDTFQAGQIVVGLIPGADINAFNARHQTTIIEQIAGTDDYLLAIPPGTKVEDKVNETGLDAEAAFSGPNFNFKSPEVRQSSVAFVDQSSVAFVDGQSPPKFYGQPALANLHLTEARNITRGAGVRVAVIDTGLDFNHPLFAGRLAYPVFDFVDNDGTPTDEPGGRGFGHGTFVSGLITLAAPDAQLMPLRVFGRDGQGTSFNIAKAIRYATDNGAQVINMSFGLLQEDKLIKDMLSDVYEQVYMVASAGNDNQNAIHYPAAEKSKTFSVTSVSNNDVKAAFANYNTDIQGCAPGVSLYSAWPGGRWATWSGTSFSTALVTGEAALLLAVNPEANRSLLNQTIVNSGVNIDPLNPNFKGRLGTRIDYYAAVNLMLTR